MVGVGPRQQGADAGEPGGGFLRRPAVRDDVDRPEVAEVDEDGLPDGHERDIAAGHPRKRTGHPAGGELDADDAAGAEAEHVHPWTTQQWAPEIADDDGSGRLRIGGGSDRSRDGRCGQGQGLRDGR